MYKTYKTLGLAVILLTLMGYSKFYLSGVPASTLPRGIAILMYHHIDNKKSRFSVSPQEFKEHLEKLFSAGFVTARLEDIIMRKPNLKNKKLVVLRFDDSKKSHIRYIKNTSGQRILDPECAVAILLDFYQKHPAFGKHALFCIVPHEEFHQPRYTTEKLLFLLSQSMELANHSYTHKKITYATVPDIDKEFGQAMAYWEQKIGPYAAAIKFVATPFGSRPLQVSAQKRLEEYSWAGKTYKPLGILYAGRRYTRLCSYPDDPAFDPYQLPSIEVTSTNFDTVLKYINSQNTQ